MSADDQLDDIENEGTPETDVAQEELLGSELPEDDAEEEQPEESEDTPEPPAFEEEEHNVESSLPYRVGDAKENGHLIAIPSASYKRFSVLADGSDNLKIAMNDTNRDWAEQLGSSVELYQKDAMFDKTLAREGSIWTQTLRHNDTPIGVSRPKIGTNTGSKLSGEQAMLHVRSITGLGTVSNVPLPHTGIWVKMKAPSDDTLLMLDGLIANEKYILGRMTLGKAFSHNSCYITKHVVDVILDHVYASNIKGSAPSVLRSKISVLDYPILIHGFLCTIHPNGYDMSQPCVADVGKCINVTKARVAISKLLWNDREAYTPTQLNMLAQRGRVTTDDDLEKYAKETRDSISSSTITISEEGAELKAIVKLRVPTLDEDIDAGIGWVDSVVNTVNDAMRLNSEERNIFIIRRGQAQNLCTYNSWVESIDTVNEEGEVIVSIDDRPTIIDTLSSLSESSQVSDKVLTGIREYIEECTKAVVGVPDYICPSCNKSQLDGDTSYKHIIPLNIEGIFFNLTRQRIETAQTTREI